MKLQSLANKSIVVIATFCDEFQIVVDFQQFRIGENVTHNSLTWQIVDIDTFVNPNKDCELHNFYTLSTPEHVSVGYAVCEIDLLQDNPRPAPANIFDALAHVLPVPQFVHGAWLQKRTLMGYLKNTN